MLKNFCTHTGEIISGDRLLQAMSAVAEWSRNNALAVRQEDLYASHVSEATKERILKDCLEQSERIRNGTEPMGFWLWQRINTELTGECVGFLSIVK